MNQPTVQGRPGTVARTESDVTGPGLRKLTAGPGVEPGGGKKTPLTHIPPHDSARPRPHALPRRCVRAPEPGRMRSRKSRTVGFRRARAVETAGLAARRVSIVA